MNKTINYQRVTEPTVFITQNRQRVKQYDNVVYLNNGEEFELELFNPTSNKILAKIKLNNEYLQSGIVLRPGERVFLERYINEAKKFVFEIYNVDGNDDNVQRAIADNGDIEVEFYQESINPPLIWNGSCTYAYDPCYYGTNPVTFENHDPNVLYSYSSGDVTFKMNDDNTTLTSSANIGNISNVNNAVEFSNDMETGRVERGSHSNQEFEYDGSNFCSWYTWKTSWKILPKSRKAVVREELAVYCTGCGAKRKKGSHKFCPHCGTKF